MTPFDRAQRLGYRPREFFLSDVSGHDTAADAVASWLSDATYEARLLGPYSEVGVGYATAADGTPYWCILVASPKDDEVR